MKVQDNISPDQITNFLRNGAFLRWDNHLYLVGLSGPTKNKGDESSETLPLTVWSPFFFDLMSPKPFVANATRITLGSDGFESFKTSLQICVEIGSARRTWNEPQKDAYKQSFLMTQAALKSGQITKAVPFTVRDSGGTLQMAEKAALLLNSLTAPKSLYAFGFWDENSGIIGTTPELLFSRHENIVRTMALAGTKAKDESFNALEFLSASKEKHEHDLVITDIKNQLKDFGNVHISETEVVEYPHLAHLKTSIELELKKSISDGELIRLLHPTPALGVAPRTEMSWFKNLPLQNERRRYGAPLLFQWQNQAVVLVCIRAIEWNQNFAWVSAGGGVVKESNLEGEWDEIKTKLASIWKNLGLERIST